MGRGSLSTIILLELGKTTGFASNKSLPLKGRAKFMRRPCDENRGHAARTPWHDRCNFPRTSVVLDQFSPFNYATMRYSPAGNVLTFDEYFRFFRLRFLVE
jgi:hypothetical protein